MYAIVVESLLLLSCRPMADVKTEFLLNVEVDVEQEDSVSDLFDKEYIAIPLETNDNFLIAQIDKIQMTDSCIYIADAVTQGALFIFDREGYFLNKIQHRGTGKGEYVDFVDFDVFQSKIYILSRASKKIFIYSSNDDLLDVISLDDYYQFLHVLDERKLLLYSDYANNTKKNLICLDYQDNKIIDSYLPFPVNQNILSSQRPFNVSSTGKLFIKQPYNYTIYKYDAGGLYEKYKLAFNTAEQLPQNIENLNFNDLYKQLRHKSLVKQIFNITQIDSTLYLNFTLDYRINLVKVDLSTGEYKRLILEDRKDFPFSFMKPETYYKDYAVSFLEADVILEMNEGGFPSNKHKNNQLSLDDNPVLFLRKLKK